MYGTAKAAAMATPAILTDGVGQVMISIPQRATICLLALQLCGAGHAQLVQRFRQDGTGAGQAALTLARQALDHYCRHRESLPVPDQLPPLLLERSAVFVSAMRWGAPRCCMGSLYPRGSSLAADIIDTACSAAAHDLRFPPIRPTELAGLRVIVSILDAPVPITDPATLDPLTDGLAVRSARRTGVVLPQETPYYSNFLQWALIRAAARPGEKVEYFRLNAIRIVEPAAVPGPAQLPVACRPQSLQRGA
jgi:uncharacterized protein